jgi:hypothetical protein
VDGITVVADGGHHAGGGKLSILSAVLKKGSNTLTNNFLCPFFILWIPYGGMV